MRNDLIFDFIVDKSTNTVTVKKEFEAELSSVWDAFTKQEVLDLWWAPKPWVSKTKIMNFEAGGKRFYAMVSPEGDEHWSLELYHKITPQSNFKYTSAFADQEGNVSSTMPTSEWDLNFSQEDNISTVNIIIKHKSLANLEQLIAMGFQGGFTMTLTELSKMLSH